MLKLAQGTKIIVFNEQRIELGEGTLLQQTIHPELHLIAYECEEHTILAKGVHFVRVGEQLNRVAPNFDL